MVFFNKVLDDLQQATMELENVEFGKVINLGPTNHLCKRI